MEKTTATLRQFRTTMEWVTGKTFTVNASQFMYDIYLKEYGGRDQLTMAELNEIWNELKKQTMIIINY